MESEKCYLCGNVEGSNVAQYLYKVRGSPVKEDIGKMICANCLTDSIGKSMKPIKKEKHKK